MREWEGEGACVADGFEAVRVAGLEGGTVAGSASPATGLEGGAVEWSASPARLERTHFSRAWEQR